MNYEITDVIDVTGKTYQEIGQMLIDFIVVNGSKHSEFPPEMVCMLQDNREFSFEIKAFDVEVANAWIYQVGTIKEDFQAWSNPMMPKYVFETDDRIIFVKGIVYPDFDAIDFTQPPVIQARP